MGAVIFDIETIVAPIPDADRPTIEAAAARSNLSLEEYAAFCPALAQVVAVGMLQPSGKAAVFYDTHLFDQPPPVEGIELRPCGGEAALLSYVHEALDRFQCLITFNGRGFDQPVLIHRAILNGVKPAAILLKAAWAKPWEADAFHVDMANKLTLGGATRRYSLATYSIGYGFLNPKADGDGGNVAELVKARDGAKLCRYVLGDCEATAGLARAWGVIQ